jgi:alpha-mannosidase
MIVHGGNQYFKLSERGLSNLLLREWESHFTSRCDWQVYTEYSYALFPHKSIEDFSKLIDLSREKDEIPVIYELGNSQSFGQIESGQILSKISGATLSSIRKVDEGVEVRVFNPSDKNSLLEVSTWFNFSKAYKTDMLSNVITEIPIKDGKITHCVTAWEIATFLFK